MNGSPDYVTEAPLSAETAETSAVFTEGRARGRQRRAFISTGAGLASKAVSILLGFATVPLALKHLDTERYGMWLTITSFAAVLGFADLGIGNGLLNSIAKADGTDDRETAKECLSSAFFSLSIISILTITLLVMIAPVLPWASLFNVRSAPARAEASSAMLIFFICTALQMPLGVVQRVQLGYQEGYISSVWQIVGFTASFGAFTLAAHLGAGLPLLLLAYTGTGVLVIAVNFIYEFRYRRPWLIPRLRNASQQVARSLLQIGVAFIALQLANWIAVWSDNLVVAQVLGGGAVAQYGIAFKLFSAAMLYAYVGPSLWPAFAESLARGDREWACRVFYKGLFINLGLSAGAAIILLFSASWIIKKWAGPSLMLDHSTTIAFCIWLFVYSFVGVTASLCNSGVCLVAHTILFVSAALISIPLRVLFANRWGMAGVVHASTLVFGLLYIMPVLYLINRFFQDKPSASEAIA